jgi:uncharacterized membrane protein
MKTKWLLLVSLLVVAAMVAWAIYTAGQLPEGAQLPTHFDAAGNPDRYTDALPALLINPAILFVVSLLFTAVPYIEPLQDKLEGSAPLLTVAWIGMLALMPLVQLITAAPAYGWDLPPFLIMSAVGVLLIAMGNWLPKSRPGFFVGIRTPWTITDTDVWIATHRLAGKLFMLGGAVMVIAPFLPLPPGARVVLTLASILVAALVPVVYSFLLWRRLKAEARN